MHRAAGRAVRSGAWCSGTSAIVGPHRLLSPSPPVPGLPNCSAGMISLLSDCRSDLCLRRLGQIGHAHDPKIRRGSKNRASLSLSLSLLFFFFCFLLLHTTTPGGVCLSVCLREYKPLQKMGCATKVSTALFWANCLCLDVAYCSKHFGRSRSRSSSRRSSVVAVVVVVVIPAAAAVALLDTVFARWAAGVKGGVGWAGLEIMTNTIASNNYFVAILACA